MVWLRLQKVIQSIGNLTQYTYIFANTETTTTPYYPTNALNYMYYGIVKTH